MNHIPKKSYTGTGKKAAGTDTGTKKMDTGVSKNEEKGIRKYGNYDIKKLLGEGAMGKVYAAYNPSLGEERAIKILKDGTNKKRFLREGQAMIKLQHKNIVKVYDAGELNGECFMVMELIVGSSLKDILEKRNEDPESIGLREVLIIFLKIVKAINHAHKNNVVHRDIKPSNIMIDQNREPKVMDFGLAKIMDQQSSLTIEGGFIGTPFYSSPEQAKLYLLPEQSRKDIEVGFPSDIYSLGVMLYEILTGRVPFLGQDVREVLFGHLSQDPIRPSKIADGKIHKDLEAICLKALEKDPKDRYQEISDMARDIECFLKAEPIEIAQLPPWWLILLKRMKRNLLLTSIVLGSVFLTIFIIAVTVFWQRYASINERNQKIERMHQAAQEKEKKGDVRGACEFYKMILDSDAGNKEASENLSRIRQMIHELNKKAEKTETQKELDQALSFYQQVILWDPENATALVGVERVKSEKLNQKLHEELLKKNQELEGRRKRYKARLYYDEAMESFLNPKLTHEDIEKCIELFGKAIQEDPTFGEAYFQRGRAYHRLFNTEKALEDYEKSVQYNPNLTAARYYYALLKVLKARGQDFPIQENEKIIRETWSSVYGDNPDPKDKYHIIAKAQSLVSPHDYAPGPENACLEYCNSVIKDNPTFPDPYFLRAQLFGYKMKYNKGAFIGFWMMDSPKDLNQSLLDLSRGLVLDPNRLEGYCMRGAIYESIGDFEAAQKEYSRVLQLKKDWGTFYQDRGRCRFALLDYKGAIKDFDVYVEFSQTRTDKRDYGEAFMWRGMIYAFMKDKDKAESDLQQYLSVYNQFMDDKKKGGEYEEEFGHVYKAIGTFPRLFISLITEDTPKEKFINDARATLDSVFHGGFGMGGKEGEEMKKTFELTRVLLPHLQKWVDIIKKRPVLFCAPPDVKKDSRTLSFSLTPIIQNVPKLYNFYKNAYRQSPFFRKLTERYNLEKLKLLNQLLAEAGFPLKFDHLMYLIIEKIEKGMEARMLQIPILSSHDLYYRRAIVYYCNMEYEKARDDLESAIDKDPGLMNSHYGLATVLSLLSKKNPEYKTKVLYHLKRAIELGWNQFDYTLKDPDFANVQDLISEDKLRSWGQQREKDTSFYKRIQEESQKLSESGENTEAIRLIRYYGGANIYLRETLDKIEQSAFIKLAEEAKALKDKGEKIDRINQMIYDLFSPCWQREWEEMFEGGNR